MGRHQLLQGLVEAYSWAERLSSVPQHGLSPEVVNPSDALPCYIAAVCLQSYLPSIDANATVGAHTYCTDRHWDALSIAGPDTSGRRHFVITQWGARSYT